MVDAGLGVIAKGVRTMFERGGALIILFLLAGLFSYFLWTGTANYGLRLQAVAGLLAVLSWTGATVISLNILVESDTRIELSSMYLLEYHGIAWTTTVLLLDSVLSAAALVLTLAPVWLLFLTGEAGLLQTVITAPITLKITEWYAIAVLIQSLLLACYLAARLLLFPAFVALENDTVLDALRSSVSATRGHAAALVLPAITAAATTAGGAVLGVLAAERAAATIAPHALHPYMTQAGTIGTVLVLTAAGVVCALAIVATAYSRYRS